MIERRVTMASKVQPLIPLGQVNHAGIVVRDVEKAIDFFSRIFGWSHPDRGGRIWPAES